MEEITNLKEDFRQLIIQGIDAPKKIKTGLVDRKKDKQKRSLKKPEQDFSNKNVINRANGGGMPFPDLQNPIINQNESPLII